MQTAVMTMSSFLCSPRIGHMTRLRRIYGYLSKWCNASIRFRVFQHDYYLLPKEKYKWERTVYSVAKEIIPNDDPTPKGKAVTLSHYMDENLLHDYMTGNQLQEYYILRIKLLLSGYVRNNQLSIQLHMDRN